MTLTTGFEVWCTILLLVVTVNSEHGADMGCPIATRTAGDAVIGTATEQSALCKNNFPMDPTTKHREQPETVYDHPPQPQQEQPVVEQDVLDDAISRLKLSLQELQQLKQGLLVRSAATTADPTDLRTSQPQPSAPAEASGDSSTVEQMHSQLHRNHPTSSTAAGVTAHLSSAPERGDAVAGQKTSQAPVLERSHVTDSGTVDARLDGAPRADVEKPQLDQAHIVGESTQGSVAQPAVGADAADGSGGSPLVDGANGRETVTPDGVARTFATTASTTAMPAPAQTPTAMSATPPTPTLTPADGHEPPVVVARDIRTLPETRADNVQAGDLAEPGAADRTAGQWDTEQMVASDNGTAPMSENTTVVAEKVVSSTGNESAPADGREQMVDPLLLPETGSGEDIQPFNEWASKKRVEETQKKTEGVASPSSPGGAPAKKPTVRHRIKNYASPDCGAKVLAANPGATAAGNVLSPGRDEYMLNSCDARVWFVVELCEGIQASRLELSNDELYSSSPREFAVYMTDRYPTREWNKVGQFTAEDVRGPQTYNLPTVVFGKFVKVEILSHYGAHYYCTVSQLRVYGASEYEVLDTQDSESHIEETSDYEELLEPAIPTDSPNLLNRALQAVNSMVQTAKVAFGTKPGGVNARNDHCVCLEERFLPTALSAESASYLECSFHRLVSLAASRLFRLAQTSCQLCPESRGERSPHSQMCALVRVIFKGDILRAVCVVRSVVGINKEKYDVAKTPPSQTDRNNVTGKASGAVAAPQVMTQENAQIDTDQGTAPANPASAPSVQNSTHADVSVPAGHTNNASSTATAAEQPIPANHTSPPAAGTGEATDVVAIPTEPPQAQKESVFVRLSNRIKALELNMSLSQQYLDELSRKYKKQVEELQRNFNKTIGALEGTARDAEARDSLQQESISSLQSQLLNVTSVVHALVAERDQQAATLLRRHLVLIALELCALWVAAYFCLRRRQRAASVVAPPTAAVLGRQARASRRTQNRQPARRRNASASDARTTSRHAAAGSQATSGKHRRRPSDEVLNISGSYRDLLIRDAVPVSRLHRRTDSSDSDVDTDDRHVPGVGVLSRVSSPGYVDRRRGAGASSSNPYSPLRRLGDTDATRSAPGGHTEAPSNGRLVNGKAAHAAAEFRRKQQAVATRPGAAARPADHRRKQTKRKLPVL